MTKQDLINLATSQLENALDKALEQDLLVTVATSYNKKNLDVKVSYALANQKLDKE